LFKLLLLSYKTTTLVSRVLFLLKHCRIAPAEILILAFNRKAALEVRRRLLGLIDQTAEPEIAAEINRRIKDARQKQHLNWDEIEAGAFTARSNSVMWFGNASSRKAATMSGASVVRLTIRLT
jgi:superfamily I DNA/RNA helicase